MRNRAGRVSMAFCALLMSLTGIVFSQNAREGISDFAVSYVTSRSVYLRGGADRGLTPGDTLVILRGDTLVARVAISAVTSGSSAAIVVEQRMPVVVGDVASPIGGRRAGGPPAAAPAERRVLGQAAPPPATREESNHISGRIALQVLGGSITNGPSPEGHAGVVLRLDVHRLFGTDLQVNVFGRTDQPLTGTPPGQQRDTRIYALEVSHQNPRSWYGFSAGRTMSRFLSGLGATDGIQGYVRMGPVTAGALFGTQPDFLTSEFRTDQQKAAAFANFTWGGRGIRESDVTVAYARQMKNGILDRDYLYLQGSIRTIPGFNLYQSAELDLHRMENGHQKQAVALTNTYVSMSYIPVEWLSLATGYDATRNIFLMETMKDIPDTLRDEQLHQGLRGYLIVRLPQRVSISGGFHRRFPAGPIPGGSTVTGSVHIYDIARTSLSAVVRYARINGVYAEGNDIAVEVDRWFSPSLSIALKLDRYDHVLKSIQLPLVTWTAGMTVGWRVMGRVYTSLSAEYFREEKVQTVRGYLEAGVQF